VITELPAGAAGGEGAEILWSRFLQHGGWWPTTPPETAAEAAVSEPVQVAAAQFDGEEGEYPYFLYPYLSVLLGDGSGASQPWLQGSPDPMSSISWQTWVEMNPDTAEELGVEFNDIVRVTSPYGEITAPVYIFPAIRPDTIAIPFGQGHEAYSRYAQERGSNPLTLVGANEDRLGWSTVRVKVERTDETKPLARFETTIEPEEGEEAPHIPF
jgi:anaerobic selenocysteine-containing dehydrogenase